MNFLSQEMVNLRQIDIWTFSGDGEPEIYWHMNLHFQEVVTWDILTSEPSLSDGEPGRDWHETTLSGDCDPETDWHMILLSQEMVNLRQIVIWTFSFRRWWTWDRLTYETSLSGNGEPEADWHEPSLPALVSKWIDTGTTTFTVSQLMDPQSFCLSW